MHFIMSTKIKIKPILFCAEKAFNRTQHLFMMKTLNWGYIEHTLIKAIYNKPTSFSMRKT